MERRFSVHAGGNSQALSRCPGRTRAWMTALVLVSVASAAHAKPKRRDARAAFDRGVAAYQKGKYEAASEALARSFDLERDVDTLFAWAQSERKLDHCEKAIELYQKLLAFSLPAANKTVVEQKLDECRVVAAQPPPKATPVPVDAPATEPRPAEPRSTEPGPGPGTTAGAVDPSARPRPAPAVREAAVASPWYTDPVALGLLGAGLAATGAGTGFLISAKSLDGDAKKAATYDDTRELSDKARSRGNVGLIATGLGGALIAGGVVWIVMHRDTAEQHAVTGWLAPGGGGLAVAGAF